MHRMEPALTDRQIGPAPVDASVEGPLPSDPPTSNDR